MRIGISPGLALWALALCASPSTVLADAADSGAVCAALTSVPMPKADQPSAKDRKQLAGCDSGALYYGEDGKPQYRKARLCAYIEREAADAPVFGGAGVLMMIYANGREVERNIVLAKRFACEVDGAPAELDGRLEHLTDSAELDASEVQFDLCDDITSGYMSGACAEQSARATTRRRGERLAQLQARWPAAKRTAFATLNTAATAYFEARVQNEVDVSGSARGAFIVAEQEALADGLLQQIEAFEAGQLPKGDAKSLAAADAALNAAYAEAMKLAKPDAPDETFGMLGSVRPEGIRSAEREWIHYRDAWASFGTAQYPGTKREAWLQWQTSERTTMLRSLVGGE